MLEQNVRQVLERLNDDDYVLDVGGWYKPFCRADVVVDLLPYSTRGLGGRSGHGPERFDASGWRGATTSATTIIAGWSRCMMTWSYSDSNPTPSMRTAATTCLAVGCAAWRPRDRVTWLFWEGRFDHAEAVQVSHVQTLRELAAFVDGIAPLRGMDRVRAVVRAPRLARWYRDWRIVRHPLDVCVNRDAPAASAVWRETAECLSTSQAKSRTPGTATPP